MKTPGKVTHAQLVQRIADWITVNTFVASRYPLNGAYRNGHAHDVPGRSSYRRSSYICKECGSQIKARTVSFSKHLSAFTDRCSGYGKVLLLDIPFCPKCEPMPEAYSCIHDVMPPPAVDFVHYTDKLSPEQCRKISESAGIEPAAPVAEILRSRGYSDRFFAFLGHLRRAFTWRRP